MMEELARNGMGEQESNEREGEEDLVGKEGRLGVLKEELLLDGMEVEVWISREAAEGQELTESSRNQYFHRK